MTSKRTWDPARFCRECAAAGLTSAAISFELEREGVSYSSATVRNWRMGSSWGPKHRAVADLVNQILKRSMEPRA